MKLGMLTPSSASVVPAESMNRLCQTAHNTPIGTPNVSARRIARTPSRTDCGK